MYNEIQDELGEVMTIWEGGSCINCCPVHFTVDAMQHAGIGMYDLAATVQGAVSGRDGVRAGSRVRNKVTILYGILDIDPSKFPLSILGTTISRES